MELFDKCELMVVTGKGGVGRTTVAAALALIQATQGRRTVLCELSGQTAIPQAFGLTPNAAGKETVLGPNLAAITIDPDTALNEWIRAQAGPAVGRALGASRSFAHFAAAAPGARELVTITKAWELGPGRRWGRGKPEHDAVVLDAAASGHGAAMLTSPRTFADIAASGPIRDQAERVWDLVCDRERTRLVAVTTLSELPVSETIELSGWLDGKLGRPLDLVVCNRTVGAGYSKQELEKVSNAALDGVIPSGAIGAAALQASRQLIEQDHLGELLRGLPDQTAIVTVGEQVQARSELSLMKDLATELREALS